MKLLDRHVKDHGTASDGRLFRGVRGGLLSESVYARVWRKAREKALSAAQQRSPLAGSPYDLRLGGVILALNGGIPAPEVSRRVGHSVDVLLRVYAGCIDEHEEIWNERIDRALTDDDDDEEHGP